MGRNWRRRRAVRACQSKTTYATPEDGLSEQRGCVAYFCPLCEGYHLTTSTPMVNTIQLD